MSNDNNGRCRFCGEWRGPDGCCETENSLTLNVAARERATAVLSAANRGHYCDEWLEDGTCIICWDVAADVIRAAEGLALCSRCKGFGMVAAGDCSQDCCPECGGDGLEVLNAPA